MEKKVFMREDRAAFLRQLIKRFLIALPLFIIGSFLFSSISLFSIFGLFLFLIGAFILIQPLFNLIFSPMGSLIFSFSAAKEIPLNFSIPEAKIMHRNYDEALKLYKEMIPVDPKRVEVYIRIINLSALEMANPEEAFAIFQIGLKNILDQKDRQKLSDKYQQAMNTFREQKENKQEETKRDKEGKL